MRSIEAIEGAFRIGLGKFTTDIEVKQAAEILTKAITEIRRLLATAGSCQ